MSAFQANDASSILAARTIEIDRVTDTVYFYGIRPWVELASGFAQQTDASS